MDHEEDVVKDYSSDSSTRSLYEVLVDLRGGRSNMVANEVPRSGNINLPSTPTSEGLEGVRDSMPYVSPVQFQEMVIKALFQSTASLMGPSSGLLHHVGEAAIGFPTMNTGDPGPASTWNEASYHKAEARRNKKPDMMKTSAGEGSDSEEDYPLPENATPEQRSLRTRRLNRWRATKARELTSNRKAVKKSPYVIHVDGTCKPRGTHRHKWKAAVRGQCGRLDPSMDNINHHSKNVVNSIWHALEKEWEFEGFAHKAREMFEKSATKFMRNRKIQLKYKSQKQKAVGGPKPNDVNKTHWDKIVDLSEKSKMQQAASTSSQSPFKGKNVSSEEVVDLNKLSHEFEGSEDESSKRSPEFRLLTGEVLALEEDVDTQIKKLRSQLLWLESSKKAHEDVTDDLTKVDVHVTQRKGIMSEVRKVAVSEAIKENVAPPFVCDGKDSSMFSKSTGKARELKVQGDRLHVGSKHTFSGGKHIGGVRSLLEEVPNVNKKQMECGDVISMVAIIQGKEEDIGNGVLMGFAGSKFARKVIPKGWCSIQVTSYTTSGASEACPFPSGWKDQVKLKTIKDAQGRIILWPHTLLHI